MVRIFGLSTIGLTVNFSTNQNKEAFISQSIFHCVHTKLVLSLVLPCLNISQSRKRGVIQPIVKTLYPLLFL